MADELVTVATYGGAAEANIARNRLLAAGIRAVLADEETVGMAWHFSTAVGGVKLLVMASDADAALALLDDGAGAAGDLDAVDDFGEPDPDDFADPQPPADAAPEAPEPPRTRRAELARGAYRGALFGVLLLPLQLLVFWLLLRVYFSDEPLTGEARREAIVAACINLPCITVFCLTFRMLLDI